MKIIEDKLAFYDKWLLDVICDNHNILKKEVIDHLSEIRDILIKVKKVGKE